MTKRAYFLTGMNIFLLVLQFFIFVNHFQLPFLKSGAELVAGIILFIDVIALILYIRHCYQHNYYLQRLKQYRHFTRLISLSFSIVINFGYVLFAFGLGIFHLSAWFITLAVYYLILIIARLYIAIHLANDPDHGQANLNGYRVIGWLILLIIPAFIGLIILTLHEETGTQVNQIQTIILATYTFYNIGSSIARYVNSWRYHNAILVTDANLSLIISLLSIFTLQTVMLKTFGGGIHFYHLMTTIVGASMLGIIIAWFGMRWHLWRQSHLKTRDQSSLKSQL